MNFAKATAQSQPTVLIVEDEAIILMMLEDALSDAGFQVLSARNGVAALELLEQSVEIIAGLVTDIHMPGVVDGWIVGRYARERFPGLPVVYLTGDSMGDEDSSNLHNAVVLSKPTPIESVVNALRTLGSEHGAAPEASQVNKSEPSVL